MIRRRERRVLIPKVKSIQNSKLISILLAFLSTLAILGGPGIVNSDALPGSDLFLLGPLVHLLDRIWSAFPDVASCFLALFSLLVFSCGLILDTLRKSERQNFELQLNTMQMLQDR